MPGSHANSPRCCCPGVPLGGTTKGIEWVTLRVPSSGRSPIPRALDADRDRGAGPRLESPEYLPAEPTPSPRQELEEAKRQPGRSPTRPDWAATPPSDRAVDRDWPALILAGRRAESDACALGYPPRPRRSANSQSQWESRGNPHPSQGLPTCPHPARRPGSRRPFVERERQPLSA